MNDYFKDGFEKVAGQAGAAVGGAVPGILGGGAALGAEDGKRLNSWGGALGGQVGGALLGLGLAKLLTGGRMKKFNKAIETGDGEAALRHAEVLSKSLLGGTIVGSMAGGAGGAYLAHGPDSKKKKRK